MNVDRLNPGSAETNRIGLDPSPERTSASDLLGQPRSSKTPWRDLPKGELWQIAIFASKDIEEAEWSLKSNTGKISSEVLPQDMSPNERVSRSTILKVLLGVVKNKVLLKNYLDLFLDQQALDFFHNPHSKVFRNFWAYVFQFGSVDTITTILDSMNLDMSNPWSELKHRLSNIASKFSSCNEDQDVLAMVIGWRDAHALVSRVVSWWYRREGYFGEFDLLEACRLQKPSYENISALYAEALSNGRKVITERSMRELAGRPRPDPLLLRIFLPSITYSLALPIVLLLNDDKIFWEKYREIFATWGVYTHSPELLLEAFKLKRHSIVDRLAEHYSPITHFKFIKVLLEAENSRIDVGPLIGKLREKNGGRIAITPDCLLQLLIWHLPHKRENRLEITLKKLNDWGMELSFNFEQLISYRDWFQRYRAVLLKYVVPADTNKNNLFRIIVPEPVPSGRSAEQGL